MINIFLRFHTINILRPSVCELSYELNATHARNFYPDWNMAFLCYPAMRNYFKISDIYTCSSWDINNLIEKCYTVFNKNWTLIFMFKTLHSNVTDAFKVNEKTVISSISSVTVLLTGKYCRVTANKNHNYLEITAKMLGRTGWDVSLEA